MLNSRLKTVADFVAPNSIVADIGTDHGYLPIELIKSGKCTKVIAGDVNKGPYLAAKRSVCRADLLSKIDIRLGSGLSILQKDEVDIAVFCGMGGNLIRRLLMDEPVIVSSLKGLIFQPQQGYSILRHYIYEINWHIADEALAKEDGRIYQIIYAVPGQEPLPDEIELEIGPVLNRKRPLLFAEMIAEFIDKANRSLYGMEKSETAKDSRRYIDLRNYVQKLEALL